MRRFPAAFRAAASAAVLILAASAFVFVGCGGTGSIVEYRAQDVAYYTGDSYDERFRLDADDGTYERYIGGIFMGQEFGSSFWGELYESGTYEEDGRGGIMFYPKKRYDWSADDVVNLGVYERRPYRGTVTSTALIIHDVRYERW